MAHRLIIHTPGTSITIDSDNIEKLSYLSDFCKRNLEAYVTSKNPEELTINALSPQKTRELYSIIHQLGL